jgi:putative nucleotidyltransferase with HDIG domain
MTVPIRRSSVASAMMPTSMDDPDALAGLRLLVAGSDLAAVQAAQGRLSALGADATALAGDVAALARAATAAPPAAVLAVDGLEGALRERLDPFGLEAGPPVIGLDTLTEADAELGTHAAARLRALVERRALRARQVELEAALVTNALTRRRDAEAAQEELLQRLLQAAGYRDDNTHEHTQRVAALAARLARELGLGDRQVALIHRAAPLHDIGKIAIPDSILLKPGRLTAEEFEVVKTHAVLGARVLTGGSDVIETAEAIARHHHERWDGGGYPGGLAGEAIPVAARLVHLADVFDVLVHERPYKESWTVEAAVQEIERGAGTDFDPAAVRVFKRLGAPELQV